MTQTINLLVPRFEICSVESWEGVNMYMKALGSLGGLWAHVLRLQYMSFIIQLKYSEPAIIFIEEKGLSASHHL
jgi:hypothetical protein